MRQLLELKVQQAQSYHNQHTAELIETLKGIDLAYYADLFMRMYHQVQVLTDEECLSIIASGNVVFEGAQGVLLDQCYGFFPYCTRSNCTFKNALQLLSEAGFEGEVVKTGLLRAYGTRHGAGPFPTEDLSLNVAPCHNHFNEWQGNFRTGWFDAVLARFALDIVGDLDVLAITNVDRLFHKGELKIATRYEGSQAVSSHGERLEVINGELDRLEERTRQMATIVPQYQVMRGIDDNKNGLQHYLDSLSQAIGRNVDAFSASPHQKLYRTLL
jgi:adenylosuccinate synthase